MKFEDTTIPVSSTYDEDLTEQYGEYLQLPPQQERQRHTDYAVVDLNTPYRKYYNKIKKLDPELRRIFLKKHRLEGLQTFAAAERYHSIKNQNQIIRHLQQNNLLINKQLSDIINSKGWQLLEKIRKIIHPLTKN